MKAKRVPERQGIHGRSPRAWAGCRPHELGRTLSPCATRAHVTRHLFLLLCVLTSACRERDTKQPAPVPSSDAAARPRLISVGPRLLSNQTSQPVSIVGEALHAGQTLRLGAPVSRSVPLTVLDAQHAYARLPAGLALGDASEVLVEVSVDGLEGVEHLRLINDTGFPDLIAMEPSRDERTLFVASTTTDTIFALEVATGKVTPLAAADGPVALSTWEDAEGVPWLVVAHQFAPVLRLIDQRDPSRVRDVPGPSNAAGLRVVGALALVTEQARDTLVAIDLATGAERWRTPVALNPRELAVLSSKQLVVGGLETGALDVLSADGAPERSLEPGPGTPIIGGGTAAFSTKVMNGTAPRALAWSPKLKALFVSSIGPNIGPNPDKMEVSMNGGVGVVDPARGWRRHLGFGAGITEALALDDARGLLYASDVGLGLVRVIDAKKLAASDALARKALVQELALPPPEGFPLVRPAADFNVKGRAGPSLHSNPRALVLSRDGKTLWVLERSTGAVATLDVSRPGHAEWKRQAKVVEVLGQKTRRLGQILYFADLGRTAMSCDACHPEGHNEGVLFEKTQPLRVYRSTTVRGSRETPPYFTPASTHSMGETARVVGGRNRFHNPDPTVEEIEALTLFASLIPTLPNPFVGEDGAPVETLALPDGHQGHPRRGLALFEGKAGCAGCHPAPEFTMDQDPATRGRFLDVGTPHVMPLREAEQNTLFKGFGTPALIGSWDVFPMLTTGMAGLEVKADGAVRVESRFPARLAVERWAPKHGRADLLSPDELDDLLAYVMSL